MIRNPTPPSGPETFSQKTRAARSSTLYTTQELRAPKPQELRKADHATRTALFYRALQVMVVYIPFNIHSNHWVYFKIELATNTITLHDPLPPLLQTQVKDTKQFLHRLAEWVIQVKRNLASRPFSRGNEP